MLIQSSRVCCQLKTFVYLRNPMTIFLRENYQVEWYLRTGMTTKVKKNTKSLTTFHGILELYQGSFQIRFELK